MLRWVRLALPRCSVAFWANVLGRGLGAALVGDLRVQDDQPRLVGVGDVGVGLRADVDAGEVAARAALALEPS